MNPDDSRHGTYGGYTNHGCRCDRCREANRRAQARKREREREREREQVPRQDPQPRSTTVTASAPSPMYPVPAPRDWGTDDGYSPTQRLTRATDGRGNSSDMRVKVSPDVAGELAALVQSGRVPEYRTMADVVRDAIYHRLHFINSNGEFAADTVHRVNMTLHAARTESLANEVREREELTDATIRHIESILNGGNDSDLFRALSSAEDLAELLPEPNRGRLEEAIGKAVRVRGRKGRDE